MLPKIPPTIDATPVPDARRVFSVWEPFPGSSQWRALGVDADEILYCGTRGPGKTDTQLMRFRKRVGIGYGEHWRGVIFDKHYKDLDDIVRKSKRWFYRYGDGARFLESAKDYKWVWKTGEELLFRVIEKEQDYEGYHGQEFSFIGWNELCKHPTSTPYEMIMSTNRSSFTPEKDTPKRKIVDAYGRTVCDRDKGIFCPSIPLEIFSTTNSFGPGHNWVKRRFITGTEYGQVRQMRTNVFDPQTQTRVDVTKKRVSLFGSYRENRYLDKAYIATLHNERNKARKKAWLSGSWDIVAGGAFDDLWNTHVHVVPRFTVPAGWRVDRAFDWGSTHPFAVIWFAEANGEDVEIDDGVYWCPPRGTIIQIFEWYGTEEIGTNQGLGLTPSAIAETILRIEQTLMRNGWITREVEPGPADNQIHNVTNPAVNTIGKQMLDSGVSWTLSDKSPGSRHNGLALFRDRLRASNVGEAPGYYIMQNNVCTLELLPTMTLDPKDPEDIDTKSEDHLWDTIRYRILAAGNATPTTQHIEWM